MRTGKAIRFSSILIVLLGSNLCASAARAAGVGDAAAQGGQLASLAQVGSRAGQFETSARVRHASRPHGRRDAPAKAQPRRQRQRAAGMWSGQQLQSSQHEMANANSRR